MQLQENGEKVNYRLQWKELNNPKYIGYVGIYSKHI